MFREDKELEKKLKLRLPLETWPIHFDEKHLDRNWLAVVLKISEKEINWDLFVLKVVVIFCHFEIEKKVMS